jgi:hypothetical protein
MAAMAMRAVVFFILPFLSLSGFVLGLYPFLITVFHARPEYFFTFPLSSRLTMQSIRMCETGWISFKSTMLSLG